MAGSNCSTVGVLIGSNIGDGRSQTLTSGAGALIGGVIDESLSIYLRATAPEGALVNHNCFWHRQVLLFPGSGPVKALSRVCFATHAHRTMGRPKSRSLLGRPVHH